MAWSKKQLLIALMMVITGTINTLSTKWADKLESKGYQGQSRPFIHPFFQACGMFLGETSCLVVYYIIRCCRRRPLDDDPETRPLKFNPLIFLPAAMCDMCGTSLMYLGLTLTYASSFQMLRGAIIIFTALMSVAFLGRTISKPGWLAIFLVMAGLTVVGTSDIINTSTDNKNDKNSDSNGIIAGDLLIIMAQVIVSFQMVWEEKFIYKYRVPALQAVGLEGLFGFIMMSILMVPMYYIPGGVFSKDPEGRLENAYDAFIQLGNSWMLGLAVGGNVISIAFFNFSGISVTKEMSATHRMVLDSCRTLIIWFFALAVSWQTFHILQVFGFILLIVGMALYNGIFDGLIIKCKTRLSRRDSTIDQESSAEQRERLINGDEPRYSIQNAGSVNDHRDRIF